MKILSVEKPSPAFRAGIRAGDEIVAVNGAAVHDSLDYLFASSEARVRLVLERAGSGRREVILRRRGATPLGITLEADRVRRCANRCVFCFIDQNPRGMRASLYVKDEDFRLSLLYGNYLTLTSLKPEEIERIIRQRMSPLYVSVHATRPAARRRLLRCKGHAAIQPLLRRLTAHGIELHTQIVVVPGYNNGEILEETLTDLEFLHPKLLSVAVVPVGLTRHRQGLARLRMLDREGAERVLELVEWRRAHCLAAFGTHLHHAADELYFLAGRPLPPYESYEGFPQIDNGVGMVRRFERRMRRLGRLLRLPPIARPAGAKARPARVLLASGTRFAPWLEEHLPPALARTGEEDFVRAEILAVENRFFGNRVTTAGLLVGADLVRSAKKRLRERPADLLVVPFEMLNDDGLTLDGFSLAGLSALLGCPIQAGFGTRGPLALPGRGRRSERRRLPWGDFAKTMGGASCDDLPREESGPRSSPGHGGAARASGARNAKRREVRCGCR
ncbi:MAG: DUF512 domain-containing protein [Candidatus Eisenbacteria bacterium]|nr:DUF512 domain-containing protein [Candidatus Eisenbacteria bacterium]